MANVILPGVYITVRDEGLITVGGVSTGNVGIVGIQTEWSLTRKCFKMHFETWLPATRSPVTWMPKEKSLPILESSGAA